MSGLRLPRVRSFRIRIALLSTALSAAILLAFGLWMWEAVQRTGLKRVDQTIRELGERHLGMRPPPGHRDYASKSLYWEYASESLEFVLGDLSGDPFIMLAIDRDGKPLFVSDNWPDALPVDSFYSPQEADSADIEQDEGGPPEEFGDNPFPHDWSDFNIFFPPLREPSDRPNERPFPKRPPPPLPIHSQRYFTAETGDLQWRIGVMSNADTTLALGLNLSTYNAELDRLKTLFLAAALAALCLIALGGWYLAQRALRPVLTLTEAAESITVHGLDRRISIEGEDAEFGRLIQVFNDMLDRLEKSFQQAVRFSADAAHELKTPLTILQGELAQAVQAAAPDSEQQQTLNRLLEEVQRLKNITRKLLLLSLADSGQLKLHLEPVNISEMICAIGEDIFIMAPGLQVNVAAEEDLWLQADPELLQQMIQNLTSNAVKYNSPSGVVEIDLHKEGDDIHLAIANSGPGIPEAERGRIFERFFRADKAHNREVDGVGLGLSLAREIARAHRGELWLKEALDNRTVFAVSLPTTASPSTSP